MLDVHPPHAPTHTWRDFLIHIATIVIGLLIAIGLEQTVEAVHRHHVRDELRQALEDDGRINLDFATRDLTWAGVDKAWALQQAVKVEGSEPSGPSSVDLEPKGRILVPNTGVWLSARANGDVRLLSSSEQSWFTDMNRVEADIFETDSSALGHLKIALARLDKDLLGRPIQGHTINLSSMNAQQRAGIVDDFRSIAAAEHNIQGRLIAYRTYVELTLSYGAGGLDDVRYQEALKQFLDIERKTISQHLDSAPTYAEPKEY